MTLHLLYGKLWNFGQNIKTAIPICHFDVQNNKQTIIIAFFNCNLKFFVLMIYKHFSSIPNPRHRKFLKLPFW